MNSPRLQPCEIASHHSVDFTGQAWGWNFAGITGPTTIVLQRESDTWTEWLGTLNMHRRIPPNGSVSSKISMVVSAIFFVNLNSTIIEPLRGSFQNQYLYGYNKLYKLELKNPALEKDREWIDKVRSRQ
ncbi:MAG: hypothetical protein KAX05_03860 [Bacteroidales bacterium]|nr:hypothetical protein [Bacteroidales bacterium]